MFLFLPRSLCALKRIAARAEHSKFGATMGIRLAYSPGMYRADATDGRRAIIVQGPVTAEDPPWPAFKEFADDAIEAIILPKDLERACKLGEDWAQARYGSVGVATVGNNVYLGLGSDIINTRSVEGRFPNMENVIPKKRPMYSFAVDPKILADTLLAIADMLPEGARAVQFFYYGDGQPLGFCARNIETGMMIDALVVPLATPKATEKAQEASRPEPSANGQAEPQEPTGAKPKAKKGSKKKATVEPGCEPTAEAPVPPTPAEPTPEAAAA